MANESNSKETTGILVRRCPKCSTVVGKSRRYGKILKSCMDDVINVKRKIFGTDSRCKTVLHDIAGKLMSPGVKQLHFFWCYLTMCIYNTVEQSTTGVKKAGLKKVQIYIYIF